MVVPPHVRVPPHRGIVVAAWIVAPAVGAGHIAEHLNLIDYLAKIIDELRFRSIGNQFAIAGRSRCCELQSRGFR
jgi:hypothetical protein